MKKTMICNQCNQQIFVDEAKASIFKDAEQIIERATEAIGIKYNDLKKRSRRPELVEGRMILAHVLYSNYALGLNLTDVAKLVGHTDHTTIIHLLKKLENFCSVYPDYKQKIEYVHEKTYQTLMFCNFG